MRTIEVRDIAEIIRMTRALGDESPVYGKYSQEPEYVTHTLREMIRSDDFIGVIEPGKGFMFGTGGAQWYSPRYDFYEALLYISPEHRGGMLAVRMIKDMIKRATAAGCQVFWAGASTGLEENKTLALYERIGFNRTSQGVYKELTCAQDLNYSSGD